MSITKQRMNQIIKEELNRALKQRGLNEMMDQYNNEELYMDDYSVDEADDDMDMDTGIDVVPDDDMGGDEDMAMGGEEMMAPLEQEIDWSQFDDDDAESVGAAFMDAIKQLREENPDEEPTAEAVVAMMQELLSAGEDEDMGGEEMEDEADFEDEAPMEDAEEEGALNEWLQRTNLLAGTRSRR
jgi:hypothetical protein